MASYQLRWRDDNSDHSGQWQVNAGSGWQDLSGFTFSAGSHGFTVVPDMANYVTTFIVSNAAQPSVASLLAVGNDLGLGSPFSLTLSPTSATYIRALYLISSDPVFKVGWTKTGGGSALIHQPSASLTWNSAGTWSYLNDAGQSTTLPRNTVLTNELVENTAVSLQVSTNDTGSGDIVAAYDAATPSVDDFAPINPTTPATFGFGSGNDGDIKQWSVDLYRSMNSWQQFSVS